MLSIAMNSEAHSGILKCVVCYNHLKVEFIYGVFACNACKMFYRRHIKNSEEMGHCLEIATPNVNCCFKRSNFDSAIKSKCKPCRFQKCLSSGMGAEPKIEIDDPHNLIRKQETLSLLIGKLSHLNLQRRRILKSFYVPLDINPTFDQVVSSACRVKFIPREIPMDWGKWAFFCSIVSIEFLTSFDVMSHLDSEDQKIVLKETFIWNSLLENATTTFLTMPNKATVRFSDGTEILPDVPGVNPVLVNAIKSQLMGKLIDLRITNEEYVLLCPVLVCNPGLPNLSEHGRAVLNTFQKTHSSQLLHYCLLRTGGPSRYSDLLSVCHTINSTLQNIEAYSILMKFYQPDSVVKKLIDVHS